MEEKVLWSGRPSIFQFIGTYVLAVVVFVVGFKLLYMINPYPWYTVTHAHWTKDLTQYRPHHWPQFALALIYIVMLVMLLRAIFCMLKSKLTRYTLMNDQVIVKNFTITGFVIHHTEIYRVVDFEQEEPFSIIIFGLSNVVLHSTDKQIPIIYLNAIHNGKDVIHFLRNETERVRREKGVREFTTRWN